ncbi:MAG: Polysaccharide biosynthesis protein [Parcubacteria group bacterium GW2011_GWC2_45_7]|nr:MAG: Polysaccharide biosynthesis protein [Parcubacteria group bacterium GW2011_GWC2_45_7]
MPTVARNTFYLTLALVGQKILSFVYFTLLARFLGAETIGKYTFAIAFTTIFSVIADLGLQPVIVREVARAKERAEEYLRATVSVKIIFAIFAYGAVLISAYLLKYPPLTLKLIALAGVVMMLDAFHLIFWGTLRGLQNLKYEAAAMVVGQGITLIAGSIGLVLRLPLHVFMIALGLGSLWNVIAAGVILRRHHIRISPRFNRLVLRTFARYATPFALAGIFVKVYSYIDTVLIQHIKGDLEVGWYSVPYKITYAFQFFPMALSAAVYPALANAWKVDKERARWIFDRALLYAIILSVPIAFGIAALAPEIIMSIYGNDFINSILPLAISIFGLIFIFLYFPVGALLNATDRQIVNTAFMGITMAINIMLNLWLIPRYGAVGASIAAVLTNAFLWLGTLLWSTKIIKPSKNVARALIKALLAALIMLIAVIQLKQLVYWPLTIFIGGGIYAALLYVFRALTSGDIKILMKLFRKEIPLEAAVAQEK